MILEDFKKFLGKKGVNPTTQKNYLTDIRSYLGWAARNEICDTRDVIRDTFPYTLPEIQNWFNQTMITSFKNWLVLSQTPPATINRRLSGLRQFGNFLVKSGWLKENPAKKITGARNTGHETREKIWGQNMLKEFGQALKNEGQKETTIKNYLGDVRQYLGWAEGRESRGK